MDLQRRKTIIDMNNRLDDQSHIGSSIDRKDHEKIRYELKETIYRIFMTFSTFVMIATCVYTILGIFDLVLLFWIDQGVSTASLLNIEIMVQTGALIQKDIAAQHYSHLKAAQHFSQKTIDDPAPLKVNYSQDSVPFWEIESNSEADNSMKDWKKQFLYASSPLERSRESWTEEQMADFRLCEENFYIIKNFLNPDPKDEIATQRATLAAFESGALCKSPATFKPYFDQNEERKEWACAKNDQKGQYSVLCEPWYANQKDHPQQNTLSNFQHFEDGKVKNGANMCVPLYHALSAQEKKAPKQDSNRQFRGALCIDLNQIHSKNYGPFNYQSRISKENTESPTYASPFFDIPLTSSLADLQSKILVTHGITSVENYKLLDDKSSIFYPIDNMHSGNFDLKTQEVANVKNMIENQDRNAEKGKTSEDKVEQGKEQDGEQSTEIAENKRRNLAKYWFLEPKKTPPEDPVGDTVIFFMYDTLDLTFDGNLVSNNKENYIIFLRDRDVWGRILEVKDHLFKTVFYFWFPYFIFASFCYIVICYIIINFVSHHLTRPIINLTKRIKDSIAKIQKIRQREQRVNAEDHGSEHKNSLQKMYLGLQVDLLRGYVKQNKEMNDLYINFNQMAKILFVGQASSHSQFSYEALFNLHQAAELFETTDNKRGTGACYMLLGCMLATQHQDLLQASKGNGYKAILTANQFTDSYLRAINYMKRAEQVQLQLIESQQFFNQNVEPSSGGGLGSALRSSVNDRLLDDQFILAFRQYTRAIIQHNLFMTIDEESRSQFQNESSRIAHLKAFDRVGLDALEYLEKSLSSWPMQPGRRRLSEKLGSMKKSQRNSRLSKDTKRTQKNKIVVMALDGQENEQDNNDLEMAARHNKNKSGKMSEVRLGNYQQRDKSSFEKELDQSLLGSRLDQEDSYREKGGAGNHADNSFGDSCFESHQLTSRSDQKGQEEDFSESHDDLKSGGGGADSDQTHNSEASVDLQVTRIFKQTHSGRDPQLAIASANAFNNNTNQLAANSEEDQHDGFEDFKIYMNLLQIEMKILLTPCYQRYRESLCQRSDHMSILADKANNSEESFEQFDPFKARANDEANDKHNNYEKFLGVGNQNRLTGERVQTNMGGAINGTVGSDLQNQRESASDRQSGPSYLFKQGSTSAGGGQGRYNNMTGGTTMLDQDLRKIELEKLGDRIKWFDSANMVRTKRQGLQIIEKWFLQQYFYYLKGLLHMTVRKSRKDQESSLAFFAQSIRTTPMQSNALAKRTLVKMYWLLESLTQKKLNELKSLDKNQDGNGKIERKITQIKLRQVARRQTDMFIANQKMDESLNDSFQVNQDDVLSQMTRIEDKKQTEERLMKEERIFENNLKWVRIHLGHHIYTKKSIFFVLDNQFEYFKQLQMCKDFIKQMFGELPDEDLFGLIMATESSADWAQIDLEEVGKNRTIKSKSLKSILKSDEDFEPTTRFKRSQFIKQALTAASDSSIAVAKSSIKYQGLEFESPLKWVIAFTGTFRELKNLSGLPINYNINLILMVVSNEQIREEELEDLRNLIKATCSGGIIIFKTNPDQYQFANLFAKYLDRIKQIIKIYPSKTVPIIQEELEF